MFISFPKSTLVVIAQFKSAAEIRHQTVLKIGSIHNMGIAFTCIAEA
jgi:hypothetical protein